MQSIQRIPHRFDSYDPLVARGVYTLFPPIVSDIFSQKWVTLNNAYDMHFMHFAYFLHVFLRCNYLIRSTRCGTLSQVTGYLFVVFFFEFLVFSYLLFLLLFLGFIFLLFILSSAGDALSLRAENPSSETRRGIFFEKFIFLLFLKEGSRWSGDRDRGTGAVETMGLLSAIAE